MRKRRKSKKTFVLFSLFWFALILITSVLFFFCYLSFDLNKKLEADVEYLRKEKEALTQKMEELEKQSEALNKKIDEQKKTLEENTVFHPSSGESILDNRSVSIDTASVGQILEESSVFGKEAYYFKAYDIVDGDSVFQRINGKSYYENGNIGLADLKYLKMIHYNFDQQIQVGEMIVNAAIAEDVIEIFKELFSIKYEIQSMRLIDDFWTGDGDSSDSNSIDHNNTSAFCYREITGGGNLSNHAYGRAIDLNPQQNPYVWYSNGQAKWSHENASAFIDRSVEDPHVIKEGDACYNIFAKYGFSWGGLWEGIKDYQHFEKEY